MAAALSPTTRASLLRSAPGMFAVAVALNYPWELAHSGLYEGTMRAPAKLWHCFVAALGDGVLTLLIVALILLFRPDLFTLPGAVTYGAVSITGAMTAIGVEWVGTRLLHRWSYAVAMPVVPGIELGLTPLLQMALLAPAAVWLRQRWQGGRPP